MKNRIVLLVFVLISSFIKAATINVNVKNVDGKLIQGATVILYDGSWTVVDTDYTNSSGKVVFALLSYGTYNYEVYYTGDAKEFWGSEEDISLKSPTLTSNFTRYWPYRYGHSAPSSSVYTNTQVSFDATIKNKVSFSRNVKVEIWIDRDKSSTWDYHQLSSAQSVGSNGTKKFTFNFAPTSEGTYSWKMHVLSYNDGAKKYIVTDSYSWITAFNAGTPKSDLDISVKNVDGNYVENAQVKLYDENWNLKGDDYTNSSGVVDFKYLMYGTYHYEVFYTGVEQEFWGNRENISVNSSSESETFTRDWPYRYSYVTPSPNVDVNTKAAYEIRVKNKLSFSRNVKVELWVDRDQSSTWDYHALSNQQSIGSNETKSFAFNFIPTSCGTYYWKMKVLTYNDGAGDYAVTDSYSWSNSFQTMSDVPFPLEKGMLIYHSYTNYEKAWDSRLFTYNFETHAKSEISSGWNIDHEMNAHFSPDGSKIVFMGDDAGLPRDWDVYIWDIGSNDSPTNLTISNDLRDEDPKFSPDGNYIIFKQNGDIKIMDLSGTISNHVTNDGSSVEESMPFFTPDGQKVVYARGAKSGSDIYVVNSDGTGNLALFNVASVSEYYPIVRDDTSFFYTRWVSASDTHDQIFLANLSGKSTGLKINDLTANNSDAYPVGPDYLFFSSTRPGGAGGYDLYLGQISIGSIWCLNDTAINSSLDELGACFVARQTFTISARSSPINAGTVTGKGSYDGDGTANLTAVAATGYTFVSWTENGTLVSTDPNYSFNVKSNRTLTANFDKVGGIADLNENTYIYPNPTHGGVVVEGKEIETIEVINTYGEIVRRIDVNSDRTIVHLEPMVSGVYIFRLITNENISTTRIFLN